MIFNINFCLIDVFVIDVFFTSLYVSEKAAYCDIIILSSKLSNMELIAGCPTYQLFHSFCYLQTVS